MTNSGSFDLPPGYRRDPETGAWLSIPWPQDQDVKDELIHSSLGPTIIRWAQWELEDEYGPGLIHYLTGKPWRFTPGQQRFLILWYSVTPDGRWRYRSGVKRGAKGTGKDPFGAAVCNIELLGPCFVEDMRADGSPVGVRHRLPLVQIASNSEAQSKDVLRVANAMLPAATRRHFDIDSGETRTILRGGGRTEILTASEKSSEGDPSTHIMLNESHHMTESSGGHRVAEVGRRNVAKSPSVLQARLCEYTNAHMQGMDSVAERSYLAWQAQVSGKTKRADILYDSIEASPDTDLYDDESRMRGLRAAYLDSPWSDLERLSDEMLDPRTTVADSIRYYLNGLGTAEDAWCDPRKFDDLARPEFSVSDREDIAMFLDCSKSEDATGLVGSRISDGHVMELGVWQRPHGDRGKRWLAPKNEVDAAVRANMQRFNVLWFGVDPSPARDDDDESLYWMPLIDQWHRDLHKRLKLWATPGAKIGNSVLFDMRLSQRGGHDRNRLFTEAAMQTALDIDELGSLTHDGSAALRMHTHNARRRPNQWGVTLGKITRDSKKLVDLAVCMVGARMGRRIVLNSGKYRKRSSGQAAFW